VGAAISGTPMIVGLGERCRRTELAAVDLDGLQQLTRARRAKA
jgi:hypothetical protein